LTRNGEGPDRVPADSHDPQTNPAA